MTRGLTRMLENVMPKVLVLFDSGDQRAEQLAELAAEGARKIRFTEVDLRVVGAEQAGGAKRKPLESSDAVDQYDGVIVVGSHQEPSAAIETLLAGHHHDFIDRVFAAVSESDTARQRLTELGGIVVGVAGGSTDVESTARKTGERVAKVAEWVRHALSHEHGHSHGAHSHHSH